jgi:hypothetical protein
MAGHPVLSKCRPSPTGDELQSFDVFGKHLTTSDIFQNYDRKDACDKPYKCDICDEARFLIELVVSCDCFLQSIKSYIILLPNISET